MTEKIISVFIIPKRKQGGIDRGMVLNALFHTLVLCSLPFTQIVLTWHSSSHLMSPVVGPEAHDLLSQLLKPCVSFVACEREMFNMT